ncbi:membrane protein C6F6.13c [Apiospora saccharicola]
MPETEEPDPVEPKNPVKNAKENSPVDSNSHAKQDKPMAAVAPVQEYDDFGLPIRKYVSPPPKPGPAVTGRDDLAKDKKNTDKKSTKSSPEQKPDNGTEAKAQTKAAGLTVPIKTEKEGKSLAGNSDDDDFQTVPSTPTPRTPNPEPAEENDGSKTPVPTSTATFAPMAAPAQSDSKPKEESANSARQRSDTATSLAGPSIKEIEAAKKMSEGASKGPVVDHSRDNSTASSAHIMSEFSHQQLTAPHKEEEEDRDEGWQTMPAYAPYDIYDDDDRLVAKEHNEEDDEKYVYAGLGGAGKGYTRVLVDDDADSETSMDGNTKYLFKEVSGTSAVDLDEQRDAVSQMQATKDLLTEGQRIAYVGATRLELSEMLKEAETMEKTKKTKKDITMAAEAMKMWSQKIMVRLYAHMEISPAEQVMIEQLAEHGVMPQDLTPALMHNSRVKNPMADSEPGSAAASIASPRSSVIPKFGEEKAAEAPPPYEAHDGEDMPDVKTPSQLPGTAKLDIDLRWTVLCDLFLVLIADSIYDSRSRVLLERVGKDIDIPWIDICRFEKRVTDALEMQQQAESENWNEDEHLENRRKLALKRKYVMMGLATVGGGLVIGLSAGLLAPLIGAGLAAGFTTIGVGGTSSFLAGAGGAAIITSSAAASGSVIGGRAANKRMGAVRTFEYRPLHNNKRVNLIVTISGWMTSKNDDVRLPFSTVDPVMGDIYSILWEPEMLTSMGDTINILATEALTQGLQQVLGSTILISLMAALQLPVVLTKLAYLIDNPWAVSLDRAWSAGLILADSLIDRNLGTRPITLVGYSLGSRVIFSCLLELARKGAYGLVQNVYLFGSPLITKQDEWLKCRTVVAGRFLSGYNRNDWILGYLFRLTNGGIRTVTGLAPVEGIPGVENMDCSEFVVGHMDYRQAMPRLLREAGWLVESDEFTEIEDPDPDQHREQQRELIEEIEEARKELDKQGSGKKGVLGGFFSRKKKAKREDWEVYEDAHKSQKGAENSRTEDKLGNNHGVLFDVDAMRAELAVEAEQAKDAEAAAPKELKSTLPAMKLDVPSPESNPRSNLRETKSDDNTTLRIGTSHSPGLRLSSERTPTMSSGFGFTSPLPSTEYFESEPSPVHMSFDTSFHEDPLPSSPPAPPAKDTALASRPEIKSSQTLPNIAVHDPWADSDDDFGKEKEISMTFA